MRIFLSFLQFCIPLVFALLALDPAIKAVDSFGHAASNVQRFKSENANRTWLMSQGYGWPPSHYDSRWMHH